MLPYAQLANTPANLNRSLWVLAFPLEISNIQFQFPPGCLEILPGIVSLIHRNSIFESKIAVQHIIFWCA